MSWPEIKAANRKLREGSDGPIAEAWQEFTATVERTVITPPYHLAILLKRIEQYRGTRPPGEIAILDHGCGGGLTLLYLAARGYTNIYGVDVGGDHTIRNRISTELLNHTEPRFMMYDGKRLPLGDNMIDIVFSQQVLEHVGDDVFDSYYAEECRILKPDGWAIHQVPHRLTPYDSHTRTWFIHYLPSPLHRAAGRLIGVEIPDHLNLRWPWRHRYAARRHIGSCQDLTLERLTAATDFTYYDGPVRLRRLISAILSLPLVGGIFGAALQHFAMMETLSVRFGGPVGET